jgi:poly(3-hydroxybutyrate) depolymerase
MPAPTSTPAAPGDIVPRAYRVLPAAGRAGRSVVHTDVVESRIVRGTWSAPLVGETVALPGGGTRAWEAATAGEDGALAGAGARGGYAWTSVEVPTRRVMILEASGHGLVYVNGEPRTGDPYGTGYVRLPVLLKAGANELLFQGGRGALKVKLTTPLSTALIDMRDATLPDLVPGETAPQWAAVVVLNTSEAALGHLQVTASRKGAAAVTTSLPPIPPLSIRKVGFRVNGRAPASGETCEVGLRLARKEGGSLQTLDTATLTLRVRRADQTRKKTFVSGIDGSVQYYATNPARLTVPGGGLPALFLTLHGAGVEAIGQANAYSAKSWGYLVAPTNRRPYGFDWEDWGRLDALEVLDLVQKELHTDPRRTYLTGHSMGGHGVWHIGATFPDRFAAIGPSAGWISFQSYAGGAPRAENPTPIQALLQRAAAPSDTLSLARNYAQYGVYILHGGVDDNVPVGQARTMNERLRAFHRDFVYHEQPAAGHWWDSSDEPGADCVDWAPMFDFFARHALPDDASLRSVAFTTASPGVSAWCHWVGVEAQIQQHQPSAVDVRYDPGKRRFTGTTENVARLAFRLDRVVGREPVAVELDGQKLEGVALPTTAALYLARVAETWRVAPEPPRALKGPHRYGPFKEAFRDRMVFVYGTRGSAAENAWAFAKARYDAETFWVRGNGSVDVIADTAFDPATERDRGVILYGNADTNAAWPALLAGSPVQVRRGAIRVGERTLSGDDLACLFLRPRPGSERALVGIVAGSGPIGMRLTDRLPYFLSGVGFPDCTVIGAEMLTDGIAGVRAAGYFGLDWGVTSGEFAWR